MVRLQLFVGWCAASGFAVSPTPCWSVQLSGEWEVWLENSCRRRAWTRRALRAQDRPPSVLAGHLGLMKTGWETVRKLGPWKMCRCAGNNQGKGNSVNSGAIQATFETYPAPQQTHSTHLGGDWGAPAGAGSSSFPSCSSSSSSTDWKMPVSMAFRLRADDPRALRGEMGDNGVLGPPSDAAASELCGMMAGFGGSSYCRKVLGQKSGGRFLGRGGRFPFFAV